MGFAIKAAQRAHPEDTRSRSAGLVYLNASGGLIADPFLIDGRGDTVAEGEAAGRRLEMEADRCRSCSRALPGLCHMAQAF